MGIRIFLANSVSEDGASIQCEVEPEEKMEGLIETALGYWELDREKSYAVKTGVSIVEPGMTISSLNIKAGDRLVVVDPDKWKSDLESVKVWIQENIGGSAADLELLESEEDGCKTTRYLVRDPVLEGRKYEIVFGGDGVVKTYRPVQ